MTDPLDHTRSMSYDAFGNIESVTDALNHTTRFVYSRSGQLLSVTDPLQHTTQFTYAGGDLATSTDALGRVTRQHTNAIGQITAITRPDGTTARYGYNANGQLVLHQTRSYLYDGFDVVAEFVGGLIQAVVLTGASIDERFARTEESGTRWFLADGTGSTLSLADEAGVPKGQYTYEAFGRPVSTGGDDSNPFQYTGREYVSGSDGLFYYRARFYSAMYQRFISEDPLEFEGGLNLYAYAHNDPVNFIDPYGTCECVVEVRCRGVHDWRAAIVGAQHSYFVVTGRDDITYTARARLTAGPDRKNPTLLRAYDPMWINGSGSCRGQQPIGSYCLPVRWGATDL